MALWFLLLLAALPALGQRPPTPQNMLPGCPDIVSKSEWRALSSQCVRPLNLPVDNVLVSHTAGNPCFSPSACEQNLRIIQADHVLTRGWCDIAYNFLIGEDGLIYEGRGWSTMGAHTTTPLTHSSLGISFIGNFRNRSPAPEPSGPCRACSAVGPCMVYSRLNIPSVDRRMHWAQTSLQRCSTGHCGHCPDIGSEVRDRQ